MAENEVINRCNLERRVAQKLRKQGLKKPVHVPKRVFHISDDDGNTSNFTIKPVSKETIYTIADVKNVISAFLEVICENIRNGEDTTLRGFGTFTLVKQDAYDFMYKRTGKQIHVDAHYAPKFRCGLYLRKAARAYGDGGVQPEDEIEDELFYDDEDLEIEDDEDGSGSDGDV